MKQPITDRFDIRMATERDTPVVFDFIRELAEYEQLQHNVEATVEDIHEALFGQRPVAEALIAYVDGRPAGFALFFMNFSTFVGKPGLYLEDLYVKPELRGQGCGKAMLVRLARLARERGCGRFEWAVLDWNTPSIEFYKKLGARLMSEWILCRMGRDQIAALAELDSP